MVSLNESPSSVGFHKHNGLRSVEQDVVAHWIVADVNVTAFTRYRP